MLTGVAAGLVFGIQDALTRQTLQILNSNGAGAMFTTWAPYALVGAGAIGIGDAERVQRGPRLLSLPAISAGEPLVGILLGVLVFGDRIQISPRGTGAAGGRHRRPYRRAILVGRAPALSQLRRLTPPSLPHITGGLPSPYPAEPPEPPGLPGLTGRRSTETDQADKDQSPNPTGDARPRGNGDVVRRVRQWQRSLQWQRTSPGRVVPPR